MTWEYSILDAVQLMIPVACTFLLLGIVFVYTALYSRLRERIYLSGQLLSAAALAYIFLEFIIVACGWVDAITFGRMVHRFQQVLGAYFLFVGVYFTATLMPQGSRIAKFSSFMAYLGLIFALIITVLAFVLPESFISVSVSQPRMISPGDFARGQQGWLYNIRDLLLGSYLLLMIVLSIAVLFLETRDKKTPLIIIGTIMAPLGAIDDILFFQFGHNILFNSVRYSRVSVGFTIMIAFIMAAVLREFFHTHAKMNKTLDDLEAANNKLSLSEQKYRKLAEGTDQAVFSLSPELRFLSANGHAKRFFSIKDNDLDAHFFDLSLQGRQNDSKTDRQIMFQHMNQLTANKEPVSFHSVINDVQTGEPQEFAFHIDYYENETGEVEYIGRASKQKELGLARCIDYEKVGLTIGNKLVAIDDVTTRLTSSLPKFFDQQTVLLMKMGLQEMVINAIEHGNLGITFEAKSRAIREGRYLEFLRERQMHPDYRDKKVSIEYALNENSVRYLVSDDGDGFDIRAITAKTDQANANLAGHGRGITLTNGVYDLVKYNKKGNQVLLEKNLVKFEEAS